MMLYKNDTPHTAIVTVEISGGDNLQETVEIGIDVTRKYKPESGIHDFIVEGGAKLDVINPAIGKLLSVRNAP